MIKFGEKIKFGDKVRVSDPCYSPDTWCAGTLENVKPGFWKAEVRLLNKESRVQSIKLFHTDMDQEKEKSIAQFEVGVDAGVCGFYDEDYFNKVKSSDESDEAWYDKWVLGDYDDNNPLITYPTDEEGVIRGIITESGFGDGSYRCRVWKNESGQIVSMEISYISPSYEDEDEE